MSRTIKYLGREALQGRMWRSNHGSGRIDAKGMGNDTDRCWRTWGDTLFLYKDKTVMRPSLLYDGNILIDEKECIYWNGFVMHMLCCSKKTRNVSINFSPSDLDNPP